MPTSLPRVFYLILCLECYPKYMYHTHYLVSVHIHPLQRGYFEYCIESNRSLYSHPLILLLFFFCVFFIAIVTAKILFKIFIYCGYFVCLALKIKFHISFVTVVPKIVPRTYQAVSKRIVLSKQMLAISNI